MAVKVAAQDSRPVGMVKTPLSTGQERLAA